MQKLNVNKLFGISSPGDGLFKLFKYKAHHGDKISFTKSVPEQRVLKRSQNELEIRN